MPGYHVEFNHDLKRHANSSRIDTTANTYSKSLEKNSSTELTSHLLQEQKKNEDVKEKKNILDRKAAVGFEKTIPASFTKKLCGYKNPMVHQFIYNSNQASKNSIEEYKGDFWDHLAYVAKIIAGVLGLIIILIYFYFRFKVFLVELKAGFAAALAGNLIVVALYIILLAVLLYLFYVGFTNMINWILQL
jgi:hypothetical protein